MDCQEEGCFIKATAWINKERKCRYHFNRTSYKERNKRRRGRLCHKTQY